MSRAVYRLQDGQLRSFPSLFDRVKLVYHLFKPKQVMRSKRDPIQCVSRGKGIELVCRGTKLSPHLNLVPSLRMSGATPLHLITLCCVHRDKFTLKWRKIRCQQLIAGYKHSFVCIKDQLKKILSHRIFCHQSRYAVCIDWSASSSNHTSWPCVQ